MLFTKLHQLCHKPYGFLVDLTGEHIKSKEDTEAAFHALNLCPQKDKEEKSNGRKGTGGTSKSK